MFTRKIKYGFIMKIILTGHKGFIGSHYLNLLKSQDNIIHTYDKLQGQDLCDPMITKLSPTADVVVHMAATNGTKLFYEIPTEVAFNNTIPTFNLIERYNGTNTKFVIKRTYDKFKSAKNRLL